MLEKDFKYYRTNQNELVRQYLNKFIIIRDEKVVDVYDDEDIAYFESVKKYGLGNFFLIKCEAGEDSYTQVFHSRVILT